MCKRCMPLLALLVLPAVADAVEIKNFRPCYAPLYLGTERKSDKLLPGDVLFATYDIVDLKTDPKTGKASFVTIVELFDASAKSLFEPKETPNEVAFHLGGTRVPSDLHVQMGRNQKPGKYRLRLTVQDRLAKSVKSHIYSFELLPPSFGIGAVVAPAIGFSGLPYSTKFALFDMTLDAQSKPNVEVVMQVLDDAGKPVSPPVISNYPNDLPPGTDLQTENLVPIYYPIFLNRPGRFTIDILAKDNNGKKEARLTYALTVLDLSGK
jgi:hypothetical protein